MRRYLRKKEVSMEESKDNPAPVLDVERAISMLSERLRVTLALLHPLDNGLAALTIAGLPNGSRSTLAGMGAIAPAANEEPAPIRITDFGREMITACNLVGLPRSVKSKIAALEEQQARRAAAMGPQVPVQIAADE
jgi:hypothetical protein